MSLPHKNDFGDSKSIHHWLLANEGSTTGKGLALDQVPDSDGPSRIHDWLEKDTSGPEAKSLVSRLCEECVKGAKAALRSIQTQNAIPTVAYRSLERSGSSFILWVDGHRVTEGQLDHTLEKSRMLRKSLLKLLISIGSTLSDVPPSVTHPRTQILEDLTSEAREAYQSTSGSSDSEDSDFDVSSVSGPTDWGEIADNMRTDIECLMDLESLIESPFIDNRKANSFNESTKYMNLDTRCQFYSDKIGHRFPEAEPDLVDRLATASWDRFLRIRMEKNNILTEENDAMASTALVVANKSEKGSSFYDSGLGTSLATTSAYAETVMSYRQNNDRSIKIPPMPEEGKRGDPFECVACGRRVTMASNSGWKRHLYNDLRPWVCHQTPCRHGVEPFNSRDDWIQHLALEHGFSDKWGSFQCPLCLEDTGCGKKTVIAHLSRHLEEISLSALPAGTEPDNESTVDSDIAISTNQQTMVVDAFCGASEVWGSTSIRSKESPDQTAYDLTAIAAHGLQTMATHILPQLDGENARQNIVEAELNLRDQGSSQQVSAEDTPSPLTASNREDGNAIPPLSERVSIDQQISTPKSDREKPLPGSATPRFSDYVPTEPPPRRKPVQIRGWNIHDNKIQRHRADQSDATIIDSSSLPRDLERFLRQNLPDSNRPAPSNTIESGNTIIQSAQTKSEPRGASGDSIPAVRVETSYVCGGCGNLESRVDMHRFHVMEDCMLTLGKGDHCYMCGRCGEQTFDKEEHCQHMDFCAQHSYA